MWVLLPSISTSFSRKKLWLWSGFPPCYLSGQDKDEYVKELEINETISLNKDAIQHNAGLRSVAKICLNSLWGKFGQR